MYVYFLTHVSLLHPEMKHILPEMELKLRDVATIGLKIYVLSDVGYTTIDYSAMLHYVPWAIWIGKSRNHDYLTRQFHWFLTETTVEN